VANQDASNAEAEEMESIDVGDENFEEHEERYQFNDYFSHFAEGNNHLTDFTGHCSC